MKTRYLFLILSWSFAGFAAEPAPQLAAAPPPSAPPKFSAAQLEKLAMPIAMHPDPLVAIILPASVYPLEIVKAARFVRDTNNLPKLDEQSWDQNVKAVARFPELIAMMDAELSWTADLGEAFLEQPKELMDAIQTLRAKAQALGSLQTSPQQIVVVTNTVIQTTVQQQVVYVTNTVVEIRPVNPQVIYVPTYPPSMYYYYPPPVYIGPPPAVTFAVGVTVGLIIANNCNWHSGGIYVGHHGVAVWGGGSYHGHGNVNVNVNRNVNINKTTINNVNVNQTKWQPDSSRLSSSGTPGSKASTQTAQARGWSSGVAQTQPAPKAMTNPARSSSAPSSNRNSASPNVSNSSSTQAYNRPGSNSSYNRPASSSSGSQPTASASRQSAFNGVNSAASPRDASNRGSSSRGGSSRGGRR